MALEVFGDVLYHFLSFAGIICHVVVVALAHIEGESGADKALMMRPKSIKREEMSLAPMVCTFISP